MRYAACKNYLLDQFRSQLGQLHSDRPSEAPPINDAFLYASRLAKLLGVFCPVAKALTFVVIGGLSEPSLIDCDKMTFEVLYGINSVIPPLAVTNIAVQEEYRRGLAYFLWHPLFVIDGFVVGEKDVARLHQKKKMVLLK